jgi:hypothetical protein
MKFKQMSFFIEENNKLARPPSWANSRDAKLSYLLLVRAEN